jgi:carboxypeptidase Taq
VTQGAVNVKIVGKMGCSLNDGFLDAFDRPLWVGSHDYVRLTTRYTENNFLASLTGTMHEAG